jgi:hypothetical protein
VKCKHENADHLMPGDYYSNGKPFGTIVLTFEIFVCLDCNELLSLGPSNDDSEAVRCEIRAAEIAASEGGLFGYRGMTVGEWYGWEARSPKELSDYMVTGYLARAIAEHGGEAE